MSALEPLLQRAGFTDYEARAYAALLHKSPQTGYELAKTSGIPRGNIYGVLQKLELRGAATRVVSPDGVRYTAVQPELVLQRMKDAFHDLMADLEQHVQMLATPGDRSWVESFNGRDNLLVFAADAIASSEHSLWIAVYPEEAACLSAAVQATARRATVKTMCLANCPEPCPGCHGPRYGGAGLGGRTGRSLIVIADGQQLVAGAIGTEAVSGIRTRSPFLVQMFTLLLEQNALLSWLVQHADVHWARVPAGIWTPPLDVHPAGEL